MNKHQSLMLKMDGILAFIDLKFWLLAWILVDLYRNTAMLGTLNGKHTMRVDEVLGFVWDRCGSPYVLWIPIVVVGDVLLKGVVKMMLD